MFIGREKELAALEKLYQSGKFEFAVIYGRRRVGKTALINHFLEGKPAIYFMGVESNAQQNLDNFSNAVYSYFSELPVGASFRTFQSALEYVFQRAEKERLVLAVDEYPYVARASESLASTLQMLIDKYKDRSKLMLILCGSSMSYMEDEVLAYKAPLYGRRTAQFKVMPFSFGECCRCYPDFSAEDKAMAYGLVGGTPQYVLRLDDKKSIEENIKDLFLDPGSALFEEPENLLKQEVREPALYNAILTAIAGGASRMAEISSKVGESTGVCAAYLKNLAELGLIKKETPYNETTSRRTIYRIEDNLFRFWYRFVPENLSLIARGAAKIAYSRIEPHLSEYMGGVFEDICREYLWTLLLGGKSPILFAELGRWWGSDPVRREQTEIDIMGEADKHTALFAECKWTRERVDLPVLETLLHRSGLFPYEHVHLYLFSRSGFTKGCVEKAESRGNVSLVAYEEMLRRK